ncbi:hypothetical protein K2173_016256 [Erythroxylum novogranatense]|uniref:Nuclear transcription factor Y subunit n=1 Tax=Erythroxylum novogranatense TaxID=1862640 RepID=A0AAV8SFW1_9ROSI|nr:hypothetical protein K2173_016256 [Erythroxylum novogranatense]
MALQVQNLSNKKFGQPHFTVSRPSWWTSNKQQTLQPLNKNLTSKVKSAAQVSEAKLLHLLMTDQESSSSLSIGQSHNELDAVGGNNSQDQCILSKSDESGRKGAEGKTKPNFLFGTSDITFTPSQVDYGHSLSRAPYHIADPYLGGLFNPYGPQAIIQPQLVTQMMGMTATRVPLPLDVTDDGPIYVNVKQYHGILRRRQYRAKLEAQNKLVKTRKPYLHESRHRHALNRVRGSGGRFLNTKKLQQSSAVPTGTKHSSSDTIPLHQNNATLEFECSHPGIDRSGVSRTSCSDHNDVSNGYFFFMPPDSRFSGVSAQAGRCM